MIIEYLLFIGSALYLVAGSLFFYLFTKTVKAKDGSALIFLKILTLSLSIGSFVIFTVRILTEYGEMDFLIGRAIAVFNPLLLVAVGLYLRYLFCQPKAKLTKTDTQNINTIKRDVKENGKNIGLIKDEIIK